MTWLSKRIEQIASSSTDTLPSNSQKKKKSKKEKKHYKNSKTESAISKQKKSNRSERTLLVDYSSGDDDDGDQVAAFNPNCPPISLVPTKSKYEIAMFGCGEFWNPQRVFERQYGVKHVIVGYTGGQYTCPSFDKIGDHTMALMVEYNPKKITYLELLEVWHNNDYPWCKEPTDQTQSAIFTITEKQYEQAYEFLFNVLLPKATERKRRLRKRRVISEQPPVQLKINELQEESSNSRNAAYRDDGSSNNIGKQMEQQLRVIEDPIVEQEVGRPHERRPRRQKLSGILRRSGISSWHAGSGNSSRKNGESRKQHQRQKRRNSGTCGNKTSASTRTIVTTSVDDFSTVVEDYNVDVYVHIGYVSVFYQAESYQQNYFRKQVQQAKHQLMLWTNNEACSSLYVIYE